MAGLFDFTIAPQAGDILVAGLYNYEDPFSWIAYWEVNADESNNFATYNGKKSDVPTSDGIATKYAPDEADKVKASGNFESQSGGVGDEWGQTFDSETLEWGLWMYNYGLDDWVGGDYDSWIGQYDSATD